MRLVQQAALRPHKCAAIPFIGNSNAKLGFIDTGQDLPGWDPHVYVSVEAVQHMARMIGWQPAQVRAEQDRRFGELEARLATSEAAKAVLQAQVDAVRVLKQGGFSQANPPGRPRKVAA